jgi:acyl-CoA synthetase (AMP-forming)/AMP-acid ligase II
MMNAPRLPCGGAHWVDHVARHAHAKPEAAAIRFEGTTVTWSRLHERVCRLAAGLAKRGVRRGDRVVILMTNRPEFVEATLAVNAIGAIAVPVNFRLAPVEVTYILNDSGAALIVADAPLAPLAAVASRASRTSRASTVLPRPPGMIVAGLDSTEAGAGAESYEAVLADGAEHPPDITIDEHDVALIMYTSGTTGKPKGAMLTHLNLLLQSITTIRTCRLFDDRHVGLTNVPLFHIAGIGQLPPMFMIGGVTVIMPTAAFDAEVTLDAVESEGVTELFLVPPQWQILCAHPGAARRTGTLCTILWGAAPATAGLLETMAATFPAAEIVSLFGQTEMSPVTTALSGADAIRKIGSVGKSVPTIVARIVDDDMNDVAPGEVGEIVYRGPTLMAGYWNNPAATQEAFAGGWFHSGDLVRADDEGFLFVVDRKKDMIISGGENIYCAEVENVLSGHPGIADIAVIGAPHDRWGETPIAVIVPSDPAAPPTLDDLSTWALGKLASYKSPTGIVILGQLPRNAAGKVVKHELRAKYGG